ncbi:MAG: MBL fold metallo-hydrolase [Dehalococcoidia bacterium]|nr:MBL fold metallo-hydrolase [Dehalococcoidia bacterium]
MTLSGSVGDDALLRGTGFRGMQVGIVTLSENTAGYGFLAEWGLSVLVEVDGLKILVDTGLSFSAIHNAKLAGIDLAAVDRVVLSHGHSDHTGGLRDFLKLRGEVEVVGHPDVWSPKYVRRGHGPPRYCGVPFARQELESLGARFNLSREPVRISERVMTSGEIPMVTDYERIEDNLLVRVDDGLVPDPLADDLALVIDADFGLVVVLGCAHRGVVNTLRHARKLTGKETVYAVIGGAHLFRAGEERLQRTIGELKETGVQRLGLSHCTGFEASARMAGEFPEVFFLNNAGTRFTLP